MTSLRSALLILLLVGLACSERRAETPPLMIFAAASLHEVTVELAEIFSAEHPAPITFNFAGSNMLAQQILTAPGADIILSADQVWLDALERAGRLHNETRRAVLSNRLVLIAGRGGGFSLREPQDLVLARYRFLALADPWAVPAGRYARETLMRLEWQGGSLWDRLAERVVPALDVRAALAMVEAEPESLGIVYRSDVARSPKVDVLYTFPPLAEVPITYGAAVVRDGEQGELARRFVALFDSPAGQAVAARYGFEPLEETGGALRP